MDQLQHMLAEIDVLHVNSTLDIRHRDRFCNRMQAVWPLLSTTIRELMKAAEHSPPRVAGLRR
jgi:hypothetical protein